MGHIPMIDKYDDYPGYRVSYHNTVDTNKMGNTEKVKILTEAFRRKFIKEGLHPQEPECLKCRFQWSCQQEEYDSECYRPNKQTSPEPVKQDRRRGRQKCL